MSPHSCSGRDFELVLASADASFRSYWRVSTGATHQIVMDAPPDKEDIRPWIDIGQRLQRMGLHTPHVLAVDYVRGFVLMEDFGTQTYLPELEATRTDNARVDTLYADALDALHTIQTQVSADRLPPFDDVFMRTELELDAGVVSRAPSRLHAGASAIGTWSKRRSRS